MLKIDADALYRAVSSTGYKLLAYHLDLDSGAITSRTLRPDEVSAPPEGPSVKPLPKLGGDLAPKKDAAPFGPVPVEPKKKLFGDEEVPGKPKFAGDFWKRDDKKKADPFGSGGFQRESGTKKLAEMFGDAPKKEKIDPFGKTPSAQPEPLPQADPAPAAAAPADPRKPRIPVLTEDQQRDLMRQFARDSGDPEIRDQLLAALKSAKPPAAFERALRKHQRTAQQWERHHRKQALIFAEQWLTDQFLQWELIEPDVRP